VRDRITQEDLMRYLDGEMPDQERAALESALRDSTELQRELAIYRAMQTDFRELAVAPALQGGSVWAEVHRRVTRPLGWIFLASGAALLLGLGVYLFALSTVSLLEKLAVGSIGLGVILLLVTVVADRYREWLNDPYRDVQR
jgi:anti-sigma factor RsiW